MNKIVMKNIRQVQTISDVLRMNRQRYLAELIKTNLQIQTKMNNVKTLVSYQLSFNNQSLVKSRNTQGNVQYNLQMLHNKMSEHIILEQIEIAKLIVIDRALSERIRNIDRKIKLMCLFEIPAIPYETLTR
jgi:hypothetical protein